MLPNQIMQSDMLDIIFEHRNKTYGAYNLRKSYYKRLMLALGATALVAGIFCLLQLLHRNVDRLQLITVSIDDPQFVNIPPPQPQPQQLPQPASQPVHVRQINNSAPVIASENQQTTQPTIDDLTNNMISNETRAGDIPSGNIVVAPSTDVGNSQTVAITSPPVVDEGPLHTAEFMPEFPGGIDALRKFLLKNIRQPDDLQAGEKIIVLASFVVGKDGSIQDVKIVGSGRTDLDREVLRVIGKMPVWKPGKQNGYAVSVYFNLPVTFIGADEE